MKKRYPLASASRRLFCRFLDFILLWSLFIGLFFLMFTNKPLSQTFKGYIFIIFILVVWFITFLYFVLIPFLSKGRTLFSWVLNMRIYDIKVSDYFISNKIYLLKLKLFSNAKDNRDKINFFINLLKREFFIWNLLCIINFFLSIVILILGDKEGLLFLQSIFISNWGIENVEGMNEYATIFTSLYSINFIVLAIIIINLIINSKKRNMIDNISATVTLYLKEILDNDDTISINNKQTLSYGMPLEIIESVFEEIDELRDKNEKYYK